MEFSDKHFDKMNLNELFDICKQDRNNEFAWKSFKGQLERYLMKIAQKISTAQIDDINDAIGETIKVLCENIDRLEKHRGWKRYISLVFIHELRKLTAKKGAEQSWEDLLQNLDLNHKTRNTKTNANLLVDISIDIHRAISKLPEDHQKVIILRYFDKLENEEIAKEIGKTKRAVENIVSRIYKELSELLKDYSGKV